MHSHNGWGVVGWGRKMAKKWESEGMCGCVCKNDFAFFGEE
jgi:hypothetical protein